MSSQESICQALNLSDSKPCTEAAVVWENLFCRFHAKQCHGLYAGYKKRNKELDGLADQAPPYLKSSSTPLANETFEKIEDDTDLRHIHHHLFREYVLLGRVIDARKLHHKHFYPLKLDYGHQAYLDTLSNRKHIVLRALERVVKRLAEVLYAKEKWFEWIEEVQHQEEVTRDKEAKKVKLDTAMFKRHWKKMETHLRAQREKEEKQRQEAFLESAYQERINATAEGDENAEMWDPIEDFQEDERSRYIDLIKHFLWLEVLSEKGEEEAKKPTAANTDLAAETQNLNLNESNPAPAKKSKKKSKPKDTKTSSAASKPTSQSRDASAGLFQNKRNGQDKIMDMKNYKTVGLKYGEDEPEPDKSNIETEEELRSRLKEGVEKNYDNVHGPILMGSLETPHGTLDKTPPLEDDEIETLMQDIKEIKSLLFCRLLLSHASLLPAALRAASVDEFLKDTEITEADLRDICLKVEQPSLQDIRDACADLLRGDEEESETIEDDEKEDLAYEDIIMHDRKYGHLQGATWFYENMLVQRAKLLGEDPETLGLKDFMKPVMKKAKRVQVQVCGKRIWNYSSESSMSREGWLQFSVLAKDCDLRHAVQLCRNWAEFLELNFLASWQYFPASNWVSWETDRLTKQLHDLGFFPFFVDLSAETLSHHHQVGGARSQQRRRHNFMESRNIMVGHMKRNDSVTRRFLQYVSMRPGELVLAVRDGKTGKIITAPRSEDSLWTLRSKQGLGRASRNEWEIHLEVGPEYFDFVETQRNWHLGFDDCYEVWIWHFVPGEPGNMLYNVLVDMLRKAWRITKPSDMYNHQEPFLRNFTRNMETQRVRLMKPGEEDDKTFAPNSTENAAPNVFYNDADRAEDAILFPDELTSPNPNVPFKEVSNPVTRLEDGAGTMNRYLARLGMAGFRSQKPFRPPRSNGGSEESVETDEDWIDVNEDDFFYDEDKNPLKSLMGEDDFEVVMHWRLPQLWKDQINRLNEGDIGAELKMKLSTVGLWDQKTGKVWMGPNDEDFLVNLHKYDQQMLFEKDRGAALLKAFHDGDLEPGAQENYEETCTIVDGILNQQKTSGSQAWFWFALDILKWLNVKIDYADYAKVMTAAWPHPFVTQDVLKAWAYMAIFFPELEECQPAAEFFNNGDGEVFLESPLLNPRERAATLPDRRAKTSFKYRPKEFWNEWDGILRRCKQTRTYFTDAIPLESSIALRSIIAKLYLAGIVSPAHMQNVPDIVAGYAVANTEPHRPGKLDLFMDYTDRHGVMGFPSHIPGFVKPDEFPVLLSVARDFATANPSGARFAVLRLWSAPHFHPAMLGEDNRMASAFLDSTSRAWRWNFIPKDLPVSEWSMYNNLKIRLDLVAEKVKYDNGNVKAKGKDKDKGSSDRRVVHRDDVILVMGVDQLDLLKYVVAVTFAIQTKPWFREFDLWKSFVNVDLEFLEGLDPFWLN